MSLAKVLQNILALPEKKIFENKLNVSSHWQTRIRYVLTLSVLYDIFFAFTSIVWFISNWQCYTNFPIEELVVQCVLFCGLEIAITSQYLLYFGRNEIIYAMNQRRCLNCLCRTLESQQVHIVDTTADLTYCLALSFGLLPTVFLTIPFFAHFDIF